MSRAQTTEGENLAPYLAWLDESGSNRAVDPGAYIVSAAIGESAFAAEIRDEMRQLLRNSRHRKLHWRDERPDRQERIVQTISALPVEHLVVVRSEGRPTRNTERQRRLCMERMLSELTSLGVDRAIIESRGRKDDAQDLRTLQFLRAKHQLTGPLHVVHAGGPTDPGLWIPDACCGTVTQLRCGNDRFYRTIESHVTLIEI